MKNVFIKRAPLTKRERRYCSCLLQVRGKTPVNPYAVCTSSVYSQQGVKRRKRVDCDVNYDYDSIPMKMIKSLAKERKVSLKVKKNKRSVDASKKTLINRLNKDIRTKKAKHYYSLRERSTKISKKH
jgi:hypothetical protein